VKAWQNRERLAVHLAFIALCAFALIKALRTTADVQWPYDLDQFRDLGMAQAILDGRYGTDHLYAGEAIWYNPLVSVIIATLSRVTGLSPAFILVHGGPYLNLLSPIAFYFLVGRLFDRWTALAAAAAFLFAPIGDAPSWAAASYSPWLFTQNFVQGLFYLTVAAYFKALQSDRWSWHLVVGILLGVTFLGHTAPAIILGIMIVIATLKRVLRQRERAHVLPLGLRHDLNALLVILGVAFVISLPFTFSILGRYHLAIVNHATNNWKYPSLILSHFPAFIWNEISLFSALALLGLFALVTERASWRKTLLLSWLFICLGAVGLNFLQQLMPQRWQMVVVPAHHFLFYLRAIEAAFFGIGLVFVCRILATRVVPKWFAIQEGDSRRRWIAETLIAVGTAAFVILALPAYQARFDFSNARSQAISFQERKAYLDAYRWILSNTKPDDVFLSLTGDLDLSIVGPADRKIVVTCQPEFSNPYVDWKSRADTATRIVDKLASASSDVLDDLRRNRVGYIITAPIERFDQEPFSFLAKRFAEGDVVIYKVRPN
jgi:dolichyl-phosphate-mannose-protein mannosyltransferase